nr:MAG TPA: hypothetical protein [Caudoviricetes sp.]
MHRVAHLKILWIIIVNIGGEGNQLKEHIKPKRPIM